MSTIVQECPRCGDDGFIPQFQGQSPSDPDFEIVIGLCDSCGLVDVKRPINAAKKVG